MAYVSAGFEGDQKFLNQDWTPFMNAIAGEEIGIGSVINYPIPPTMKRGIPVYYSKTTANYAEDEVKVIDVTDVATIKAYAGITLDAAKTGTTLTLIVAGTVWLPVGLVAVLVGELVCWEIDSTENGSLAQAGEVIPVTQASDAYGAAAADLRLHGYGVVGRALDAGAIRTSSGLTSVVQYIRVRMVR